MAISGKHGAILVDGDELPDVRNWTLTRSSDNRAYASSSTAGQTRRVAGRRDWSVTFELYSDNGNVPFTEGDSVALRLYVHQQNGKYYQGDAMIDTVRPVVDIEGAKIVEVHVSASADGALVEPA